MEETKRNQYIILGIIGLLMVVVVTFTVRAIINYQKVPKLSKVIRFNQIYSSDYNLSYIDDKYFIGSYENKSIDVIIDNNGKEIYKGLSSIVYQGIYKMKDGRYLIYNNDNDILNVYIFDGESIKNFFNIDNVSYAKPLLYKGDEFDYIVGFYNVIDNNLYIYKLDGSGSIVINNASFVAASNSNGSYYINNEKYLVVKDSEGKTGIIDFDGNIVIDYQYVDIIPTRLDTFVVLDDKNKYGIIDKNNEVLLKKNYKVIKNCGDYYLVVNTNNKMALYDKEFSNLTGFNMNYDTLIDYDLRNRDSLYLNKFNGNLLIVNNYLEDVNGIEYNNHDLYVISNNKISKKIKQKGFYTSTLLFVYDSNYEITIYDENYEIAGSISNLDNASKIENINLLSNNIIVVNYLDNERNKVVKYFDFGGNDISSDFISYGNLYENSYLYHAFLKDNNSNMILTVFDSNHEVSNSISGNIIELINEYVIVDKAIYKIEISE